MARDIEIDTSEFEKGLARYAKAISGKVRGTVSKIGEEILRLSQSEVPHDTGELQNTGHVEMRGDEATVGYNKVYAARLHENPQYNFQKGRKGKYLEDPIKHNIPVFRKFVISELGSVR